MLTHVLGARAGDELAAVLVHQRVQVLQHGQPQVYPVPLPLPVPPAPSAGSDQAAAPGAGSTSVVAPATAGQVVSFVQHVLSEPSARRQQAATTAAPGGVVKQGSHVSEGGCEFSVRAPTASCDHQAGQWVLPPA